MSVTEVLHDKDEYPVKIPFKGDERTRFLRATELQQRKVRRLIRDLCLAWMDPAAGPIVEAAMRGRVAPDLTAGQALETAATLEGSSR